MTNVHTFDVYTRLTKPSFSDQGFYPRIRKICMTTLQLCAYSMIEVFHIATYILKWFCHQQSLHTITKVANGLRDILILENNPRRYFYGTTCTILKT